MIAHIGSPVIRDDRFLWNDSEKKNSQKKLWFLEKSGSKLRSIFDSPSDKENLFDGKLDGYEITAGFVISREKLKVPFAFYYFLAGRTECVQRIQGIEWNEMCSTIDIADWIEGCPQQSTYNYYILLLVCLTIALVLVIAIISWFVIKRKDKSGNKTTSRTSKTMSKTKSSRLQTGKTSQFSKAMKP